MKTNNQTETIDAIILKSQQNIHDAIDYRKDQLFKQITTDTKRFEDNLQNLTTHYTNIDNVVESEVKNRIYEGFKKNKEDSLYKFMFGALYQTGKLGLAFTGMYLSRDLDHTSIPFEIISGMSILIIGDAMGVMFKHVIWNKYNFSTYAKNTGDGIGNIYNKYFTKEKALVSSQHSEGETGK